MRLHVIYTYLTFLFTINNVHGLVKNNNEVNDMIKNKLYKIFFESNIKNSNTNEEFVKSLSQFQNHVLKLRNSECSDDVLLIKDFKKTNSTKWMQTVNLLNNLSFNFKNESISQQIAENFNEMVFLFLAYLIYIL